VCVSCVTLWAFVLAASDGDVRVCWSSRSLTASRNPRLTVIIINLSLLFRYLASSVKITLPSFRLLLSIPPIYYILQHNMPTDVHGITHAGTIGLFDDDDENARSLARAERHEIKDLEKGIRRRERHAARKLRKEQKVADGQGESSDRPKPSRSASWFGQLFGGTKEPAREQNEGDVEKPAEWAIVAKPEPTQVCTVEDVDPVDSPFLRECGMVRVVSHDAGGCHIVPKSRIEKND